MRLNLNPPPFIPRYRQNNHYPNQNNNYHLEFKENTVSNSEINIKPDTLEYLFLTPKISNNDNDAREEKTSKSTLVDFQLKNFNKLKEDLIYYFSPIESLKHFKSGKSDEIKNEFYNDLDCENFIIAQKERFKQILSISDSDLNTKMKISKLSNFDDSFCYKTFLVEDKEQIHKSLINANFIGKKMDECFFILSQQNIEENKIIAFLNELKDAFYSTNIDMESQGLIYFSFIEKNLISILKLIEFKLLLTKKEKELTSFIIICLDILNCLKSTKLFFYIIQFLKKCWKNLEKTELNKYVEIAHFIPNNCFDFNELNKNIKNVLLSDLIKPLFNKNLLLNSSNKINLYLTDCITLNYNDFILIFFSVKDIKKNNETDEEENKEYKDNIYYYYKINLINKKVISDGKINLLNNGEDKDKNSNILDINFSIREDYIYIFYIVENSKKYYLKFLLYNKYSITEIKNGEIELEKSFIPIELYNDNKYLYCISNTNRMLLIKKNNKLNDQNYINCNIRPFENNSIKFEEINNISLFKMYNSLCINNLLILKNITNQKIFIAKFLIKENGNSILNIYETKGIQNNNIYIAYNDGRFVITKSVGPINGKINLCYDITTENFNHLIDKGLLLLPFNSNKENYKFSNDLYECLIQEYSSYLNLCGNFDLINAEKEKILIKEPFAFCCNFEQNILYFIMDNIIEKDNSENIKINYIIILKQIICSLYNSEMLNEDIIRKIIPYFRKLILDKIKSKETKFLNKILDEIIVISSFIKDNTIIEIDEIKFALDKELNDINIKSRILLIELILNQNKIKNLKELYEYLIEFEKIFLISACKNESLYFNNYHLYKKIMIIASESLYKNVNIIKEGLIDLIPLLLENIQILIETFKIFENKKNNYIEEISFFYYSFAFRSLFLIIEYLFAKKIFLGKKEYIISFYKALLFLDKININYNDCLDMNNTVEITNYSFLNENRNSNFDEIKFEMKESKDIIIKTKLVSNKKLFNSIKIELNRKIIDYNINREDEIYHDVKEVRIIFKNVDKTIKENFVINIIPVKDEKLFIKYKTNKDYKIISLIGKSLIHYILYLFEDINSEIEKYNNEKIVKLEREVFKSEIFKFLSIPLNLEIKDFYPSSTQFYLINNELLQKLNKSIINLEDFNSLNDQLNENFQKINKKNSENIFNIQTFYENKMQKINPPNKSQYINLLNENKYDTLFSIFNYDLSKKNFQALKIEQNKKLFLLIKKIFLFGIKYYNCFEKLNSLEKQVKKMKIEDFEAIKKNINQIRSLDKYSLFFLLYKESFKISGVYNEHRSKFQISNFDEENEKYFNDNLGKIEFLYDNIIPCDYSTIKPNTLIIENLIKLMRNTNVGIYEINQYSRIQNINCQKILIELLIISNLLLYLNNENNIIFILNLFRKKFNNKSIKMNSFFDDIYGANYYTTEKMKHQFHLLLYILSYKLKDNKTHYSNLFQIALSESLIWKIRKRNFPVLIELIKSFEEIKTEKRKNDEDYPFYFISNKIYNVNYYNSKKKLEIKFEIFNILINQIMNIIKDYLEDNEEKNNELNLERNPSFLSEIDLKKILENLLLFFVDINPECYFYDDLILLFYKIFNKSDILFNYILQITPNVINKIITISFDYDNNGEICKNKKTYINTRLIMIKLLCQIIQNLSEYNFDYLSNIFAKFENSNKTEQNPIIYLFNKLLKDISTDSNNLEPIIQNYYKNLIYICLNKILEIEKDKKIFYKIIKDKNFLVLFLSYNNFDYKSENKFVIKLDNINNNYKYEDISLFNSGINKQIKTGRIICFLNDIFKEYTNIFSENFLSNFKKNIFSESKFRYDSINNNYKIALIIMEDFEQFDFFDINNFEIRELSTLDMIKTENRYKMNLIEKNSEIIIKELKEELLNDKLNEKGIYLVLKILQQLIKYIEKDDLISIFNYLWKYYTKNKSEENNYYFMSLEFIEKEIKKYIELNNLKDIFKNKDNSNKPLYSLFNWIIKDNILEIKRKSKCMNTSYKMNLYKPDAIERFKELNTEIKNIYSKSLRLSNLSIYINTNDPINEIIKENSILLSNSNLTDNDLIDLSNIVKKYSNKIKVIITKKISDDISLQSLYDFIVSNNLQIFEISDKDYEKLINFFIKGEGLGYYKIYQSKDMHYMGENIYNLIKANYEVEENKVDPLENIIYNLECNELYKYKLCNNYKKGHYCDVDNCKYAHGNEELKKIRTIYNNLDKYKNEIKLKKYKTNLDKITSEINDESKNIFNIMNFKLCKRLIYDILYKNGFEVSKKQNLLEDIYYIYEVLCLEYYFNIKYNIFDKSLKEKLLSYFRKLSEKNENPLSKNKWILKCFKQIEKINYNLEEFNLNCLDLNNLSNEKKLFGKYYNSPNILYDKLLFLHDIINKENSDEYFIKYYFDIISNILNHIIKEISSNNNSVNNYGESYECLILLKIMNIIFHHFCDKLKDNNNDNNDNDNKNKIFESTYIPNNIDEIMKKLIKIDLKNYFPKKRNRDSDIFDYSGNLMTKKTAFLIEFIFKYFDLCLILLYNEEQTKFFDYMINPENMLFKYYIYYKILTLEKNNKNKYYKNTIYPLIYYIIELSSNSNKFKEYIIKSDSVIIDVTFQKPINLFDKMFKIVILDFDDKNKKYYFQDIIDFNSHLVHGNNYKLKVKNKLYLVPLKNIDTKLYSIENSTQIFTKENNNNLNKVTKYEDTPKYSWNLGYDGNKYLLLSEKDNKIYSFFEEKNYAKTIKGNFDVDEKLDIINNKYKIIDFIDGSENYSSFARTKDEKMLILEKNRNRYKWLSEKEKSDIEFPILIQKTKIKFISANDEYCYIIGKNGNLYQKQGEKLKIIEDSLKFLQCACGNGYVICLVKNSKGKGVIYSKGKNDEYQCGIDMDDYQNEMDDILQFTKCEIDENLDFKYICTYKGFSAALTSCGLLYVWGLKIKSDNTPVYIKSPLLINKRVNSIIVDKISLNNYILYAIGRKLENGNFIKKLFILGDNNNSNKKELPFILKEVNIIHKQDNNSRIIPVKILIGQNRTYFLCVNENQLIEEIIQNSKKNEDSAKITINISYRTEGIPKEEYNLEKMQKIFSSDNLGKFINLFNIFSEQNLKDLLKAFDGITRGDIKTEDIDYNELITYMNKKDEFKDLSSFFLTNEKNEGIFLFNYLKTRISYIEQNILNFLFINNSLKSESFIKKIIEQNISYLNDDFRVGYFVSILSNMIESENSYDHFELYDGNDAEKEIIIDRFKAYDFKNKFNENKIPDIYLSETIFGQLFQSLEDLSGKKFLKEKGKKNKKVKKLFKVDFENEDVIDEGGPYSEILSDICDDLQSDYIELFIKTPNNKSENGELRDRYIINPNCSNNIIYKKALIFIGKLLALAISTGETLNLNFHPIIWKSLLENNITFEEFETIDINFYNLIANQLKEGLSKDNKKELIESYDLYFNIQGLNEKEIELIENGKNIKVTSDNVERFIKLAQSKMIEEIQSQINYVKEGLYSVIEKNLLQVLNWKQLEEMVCGEVIFNIKDLMKNTVYINKINELIDWFWEWLNKCNEKDKFKYLRFVSGRSRLPKSEYEHKIEVINKEEKKNNLPVAHTCFFKLDLPNYDSKEILCKKMNFALEIATTITDY